MPRLEHKRINLAGVNLHYAQAGEGPVVLLVHGLGTSSVTWSHNIEPLAGAGYTVLAPDLPGHGDSDKPRSLSYGPAAGARVIHDFLDALGVNRVSLVGNSAGGLIAGLFALDHPLRVDRLVLVASGGLGRDVSWALRILSVPVLAELIYQPRLLRLLGVSNRLFYRPTALSGRLAARIVPIQLPPGIKASHYPGHPLLYHTIWTEETMPDIGPAGRAGGAHHDHLGYGGQVHSRLACQSNRPGAATVRGANDPGMWPLAPFGTGCRIQRFANPIPGRAAG